VVPEQCKKQHDRQRYAEQPKQSASSKAHDVLLQFVKAERLGCRLVPRWNISMQICVERQKRFVASASVGYEFSIVGQETPG
jgi:hypothetical protein